MTQPRALLITLVALSLWLTALSGQTADDYRTSLTEGGRRLDLQISSEFSPAQRDNLRNC